MRHKRGDIVLVLFPDSNLQTAKRRPALVVQADNLGTGLAQTVIAMITSNMSRAAHSSRVRVVLMTPDGQRSGLKSDSVIMTDNLVTILDNEIDRMIGNWADMRSVDLALKGTLGL
jgi:mRNA interferase MazF